VWELAFAERFLKNIVCDKTGRSPRRPSSQIVGVGLPSTHLAATGPVEETVHLNDSGTNSIVLDSNRNPSRISGRNKYKPLLSGSGGQTQIRAGVGRIDQSFHQSALSPISCAAVDRTWNQYASQGQVLDLS